MPKVIRPATLLASPPRAPRHARAGASVPCAHVAPLYQTVAYQAEDAAGLDAMAEGQAYFYARHGAPNEEAVAGLISRLETLDEGTPEAHSVLLASGMAAIEAAIRTALPPQPGAPPLLLAGTPLYGASLALFRELASEGRMVLREAPDLGAAALERIIEEGEQRPAAVYVEVISNPLLRVPDLDVMGVLCRRHGIALIVDATFATPLLCRPLAHGASLVVHSATKYLSGHGDVCAGVVSGAPDLMAKVRSMRMLRGAVIDPFAAWLLARGMRTLELRVARQVDNAERLAGFLSEEAGRLGLERVIYPGLADHPDAHNARRVLARPGAMIAFDVGSEARARRVYDRLQLVRRVASLGDLDSLLLHPASSSHRHLPGDQRIQLGITDGLLRLSVGIEDIEDLKQDLCHACSAAP